MKPARLTHLETRMLPVEEVSAIAPLGDGFALLAHDDDGILLLSPGPGGELSTRLLVSLDDLEGLCLSDDGSVAYAVAEGSGEVSSLAVRGQGASVTLSPPSLLGTLAPPRRGGARNKGWEGAAYLPAQTTGGRAPGLLFVHEDKPKSLAWFLLDGLEPVAEVTLDGALDRELDDLSDVALCPTTGHLFLLSDESRCLAEVTWDWTSPRLELLGLTPLEALLPKKGKPEGLAFESPERLVLVTDASRQLLRFRVER